MGANDLHWKCGARAIDLPGISPIGDAWRFEVVGSLGVRSSNSEKTGRNGRSTKCPKIRPLGLIRNCSALCGCILHIYHTLVKVVYSSQYFSVHGHGLARTLLAPPSIRTGQAMSFCIRRSLFSSEEKLLLPVWFQLSVFSSINIVSFLAFTNDQRNHDHLNIMKLCLHGESALNLILWSSLTACQKSWNYVLSAASS